MNSVVLTLWVSNSGSGGASISNGGSGGVMGVSGKDDCHMGIGTMSRPRISGLRVSGLAAAPGVGGMLGNGVVCRSGVA